MDTKTLLVIAIVSAVVGGLLTFLFMKLSLRKKTHKIIQEAENEAEMIKKEKNLQAKEKFLQLKSEHEKVINERNSKLAAAENKLKQREASINHQIEEYNRKKNEVDAIKEKLNSQLEHIERKNEELEKLHKQQVDQLESISGLSVEDAKAQLMDSLKAEARTMAMSEINEIMDEARLTANKESKRIILQTMQRMASEQAIENSVTVFHIENDDIKGRIIGREGRYFRALEAAPGVEFIVDDSPVAIILSAFVPVRREVARLALHQLVT
ncbi:MAG: DUF3552 domain-containing protein, partial [Salinivirgaceae bacterium]|nr:DUF3552 domain-containing protein [Salinivirgaceae bacterium]